MNIIQSQSENNIGDNFDRYRAECLFYNVEHNKNLTTQYDLIRSKINYGNMAIFIQMHYNIMEFVLLYMRNL